LSLLAFACSSAGEAKRRYLENGNGLLKAGKYQEAIVEFRNAIQQDEKDGDARFKLAITGTPMENNLMELWSLLSITAPGLFPAPKVFTEHFRKPIETLRDRERLAVLRRRIKPVMLRRTKSQVAGELPAKQEQVLEVALHPRHRAIYQTHLQRERQKVLGLIDDLDDNRFTILQSLTLLRQLALDPVLVDDLHEGVAASKTETLVEMLGEVVQEGHRALVFSQFTGYLRRVRDRLTAAGLTTAYLDGRLDEEMNSDERVV
jgi:SNF2 family DNA or RNA helicase